jgi:hypothetical protein
MSRFAAALAGALLAGVLFAAPAGAQGPTNDVALTANETFGTGLQYTDVWYHKGLAYIGGLTMPGRVFIADAGTGALVGTYATSNGSWVKDLQVQGDTLYVALDVAGLDVVDVSNPAQPAFVTRFNTSVAGVHDLFIHGNTLYYVDDVGASELHIADVSNRAAPIFRRTFNVTGGCHDLTVVGNRAYLANLSGGFQILDVTDPINPVSLAVKSYSGAFTHNIWPNGDGRYVCTTDETCGTGHLRVWDVSNLANIVQVSEYAVPVQGDTCVHNAMWIDDYIYMSYYLHGLRIVDASNPAQLVEVGSYDTHGTHRRGAVLAHDEVGGCFDGAWGIFAERSGPNAVSVYLSDIGSGLWSFSFTGAANKGVDGVGVYDASLGTFFLRNMLSSGAADQTVQYGAAGGALVGLVGDWDGNGTKTIGVYDPASGTFFLKNSNTPGVADLSYQFGVGGANRVPVVGDWDGNDTDTVGLYDRTDGTFFLRNSHGPGAADITFQYGVGGALVGLVGDWDGDGVETVGVYDPATATFFLKNSNAAGPADLSVIFGPVGSFVPLAGDWDGVGADTIGLYDPATATFFGRNSNTPGVADVTFIYGAPMLTPLVGDWQGPGL